MTSTECLNTAPIMWMIKHFLMPCKGRWRDRGGVGGWWGGGLGVGGGWWGWGWGAGWGCCGGLGGWYIPAYPAYCRTLLIPKDCLVHIFRQVCKPKYDYLECDIFRVKTMCMEYCSTEYLTKKIGGSNEYWKGLLSDWPIICSEYDVKIRFPTLKFFLLCTVMDCYAVICDAVFSQPCLI